MDNLHTTSKVCFLTHEFAPFFGGVATYVQEAVTAAEGLGYPVNVITVDYRGRDSALRNYDDAAQFRFPVTRLAADGRLGIGGIGGFVWSLIRQIKDPRSAFSQAKGYVLCSAGAHMAAMVLDSLGFWPRHKPTVALFHGSEILKFTRRPLWRFFAQRFYKKRVQHFVFASRYVESLFTKQSLFNRRSFKKDAKGFHYASCACPSFFNQLSIDATPSPSSRFRLLTVARIHPRKGQLEFVRALGFLPLEVRHKIVYSLVGTGDNEYLQAIQSECSKIGIELEILGAVPTENLPAVYQNCDVFVLPSRTLRQSVEGFGIVCLEASFFEKPIVAFQSGGIAEAVVSNYTGLLVAEGDSMAMSKAVYRLFTDSALRDSLGKNGKAYAQTFHWDHAASTICELFNSPPNQCPVDELVLTKPQAEQHRQVLHR